MILANTIKTPIIIATMISANISILKQEINPNCFTIFRVAVKRTTTTTINAIMMFDKNYITYEEKKDNFIIVVNKNNEIVDNLILNMLNMLKELANDYPKNIKIEEE